MVNVMQHQIITELWYPLLVAIRHIDLDYLQLNVQNCYEATGIIHLADNDLENTFWLLSEHGATGLAEEKQKRSIPETLMELPVNIVDVVGTMNRYQCDYLRYILKEFPGELEFHGGKSCFNPTESTPVGRAAGNRRR